MQSLIRSYLPVLILAPLFVAAQIFHAHVFSVLWLEPGPVLAGEFWRVFSAYLVHSNIWHMAMNLLGLLAVSWFWRDAVNPRHFLLLIASSALFVSLCYLLLHPAHTVYFGFSAILYSLIAAFSLISWQRQSWANAIVLLVMGGRALQQWLVPESSSLIDAPVAAESHLYGLVWGVLWGVGCRFGKSNKAGI
jgi:rhomboid family GlyGly-CTERM serine protease